MDTKQPQIDKTALSYWFPKIKAAGVPVPETIIVPMAIEAQNFVGQTLWGEEPPPDRRAAYESFLAELTEAAAKTGLPFFLRTDHTSNKHNWKDACYVTDLAKLSHHVFQLAEFSEICDMVGLPYSNWVVREFLPTIPFGTCPRYGDMPICREFRFFVDDGKVRCHHPYWPLFALTDGGSPTGLEFAELCRMPDEAALTALAEQTGRAVGGSWSIDILETRRGWFVTDMAEAHKSYHWEGCPHPQQRSLT